MIVFAETITRKEDILNSITDLLDLEDSEIIVDDIQIQGQTKTIVLSTVPIAHFCPSCGFKMHSRGIKKRTINHPIFQDGYSLILVLRQRRWRCTNPDCRYDLSESFKFVNKNRRTTNATDLLIVDAYRNLMESSASIANRFHVSDTYAHEVFDRYVKLDRLPLTDVISVDEVFLDMDDNCKYALVIQDFHTGDPIDLLRSRRVSVTEPYFASIPPEERYGVKYLISDMYNQYISYVDKYFPNAVAVVDSFHVIQWIIRMIDNYIRQLLKNTVSVTGNVRNNYLKNTDVLSPYQSQMKYIFFKSTDGLSYPINRTFIIIPMYVWILTFTFL